VSQPAFGWMLAAMDAWHVADCGKYDARSAPGRFRPRRRPNVSRRSCRSRLPGGVVFGDGREGAPGDAPRGRERVLSERVPAGAARGFFGARLLLGPRPRPSFGDERAWRYVDLESPDEPLSDELEILQRIRCSGPLRGSEKWLNRALSLPRGPTRLRIAPGRSPARVRLAPSLNDAVSRVPSPLVAWRRSREGPPSEGRPTFGGSHRGGRMLPPITDRDPGDETDET
jgi:hypothetical protein